MNRIFFMSIAVAHLVSCTTLDQSFRLGAITGALTGASATHAGHSAANTTPASQDVVMGAGIGLALGLFTSYFIHQQVLEDRDEMSRQTEIYFGDLPPSPFLIPQPKTKKGSR